MDYEKFLKEKYQKSTLSVAELSEEISISERMIADRVRACSDEIPAFKKLGSKAVFPIKEVAKFLGEVVRVG